MSITKEEFHQIELERTRAGAYSLGVIHGRNMEEQYWKSLSIWQLLKQRRNKPKKLVDLRFKEVNKNESIKL